MQKKRQRRVKYRNNVRSITDKESMQKSNVVFTVTSRTQWTESCGSHVNLRILIETKNYDYFMKQIKDGKRILLQTSLEGNHGLWTPKWLYLSFGMTGRNDYFQFLPRNYKCRLLRPIKSHESADWGITAKKASCIPSQGPGLRFTDYNNYWSLCGLWGPPQRVFVVLLDSSPFAGGPWNTQWLRLPSKSWPSSASQAAAS